MIIKKGNIKADSWSFEISRQVTEKDFLSSELADDINPLVHNGEYRSYYTKPYEVCGKKFAFSVYFESGKLKSISLVPSSNQVSWDNFELKSLKKSKMENDNWLMKNFGISAFNKFDWGTVQSVLDQKGGISSIVISYE